MKSKISILDERHFFYIYQSKNPNFLKEIAVFKDHMAKLGHPIPSDGFKNEKILNKWINRVHRDFYYQAEHNDKYLREEKKIITDKNTGMNSKQYDLIETLQEKLLPPKFYYEPLRKILQKFLSDRDADITDFDFLTNFVFFNGKIVYSPTTLTTRITKNDKQEPELWVRIYPYTRLRNIRKEWPRIKKTQKLLPNFKARFRMTNTKAIEEALATTQSQLSNSKPSEELDYLSRLKRQTPPSKHKQVESTYLRGGGIPPILKGRNGKITKKTSAQRTAISRMKKRIRNVTPKPTV